MKITCCPMNIVLVTSEWRFVRRISHRADRFGARALTLGLLLLVTPQQTNAQSPVGEPTNLAETMALKAAEDRLLDEQYQSWKHSLSPERQLWESILEANLGPYYLPLHKRAKVNAASDPWDFVADDPKLPRVLLIGDSISCGYTLPVRAALAGKANVHRAPENCGPTANGLKKLELWLGTDKWNIIYFNFGIHDRATPVADYEARLEQIVDRLRRTGATLIWASSTPLPMQSTYGSDEAITTRNAVAAGVMQKHGIPIDDLYTYIRPRLGDLQKANDVHFTDAGKAFLALQVSKEISRVLPRK